MFHLETSALSIASSQTDTKWAEYFDIAEALAAVAAHVEALPSSRTEERHTFHVYQAGLRYFMDWAGLRLPTPNLIEGFIGHLIKHRNLKSNTVASKYLAPTRLFLKKLAAQHIPVTGPARDYIQDCKEHIRAAAAVKSPRTETTTNIAPLWRSDFKRLTLQQVNATLRQIDTTTIAGSRDYALLMVAFETALRLAELHRITLAAITTDGDHHLLTVRGKRSNTDPVPLSKNAVGNIETYIDAYNTPLDLDDPRRITDKTALWQPLLHGDNHVPLGVNRYNPARGISHQAIRDIIKRRTAAALGEDNALAAHDTRRTAAAIAYDNGMPLPDIQQLLRHKDAAVTLKYIGNKPDYASRSLSTYVKFG